MFMDNHGIGVASIYPCSIMGCKPRRVRDQEQSPSGEVERREVT
ncbi:hypothetical protein SLEP1_g8430 [Rubroshorea leprosula]|uniref:Uncharacterized protein n=1 Tax=Rubroshorea leprosula TaxID=152421 RepID=A0AAV5IAX1_9ROSI|nr:hypothetical protein SLEP1_g8430 [Rubroshorea leprosula]